jgi:EAL domain-containing protein (putative c-di-GMP-specific phosphodiesterase class I)
LYAAKSSGKGRWRQYADDMDLPSRERAATGRRLETAMDSGDLSLYYQPIVEVATGAPVGFEALLRLHDDGEPMTPPQIITAAYEAGLTRRLSEWILGQALADLPRFTRPGGPACYVSVNVSSRQLLLPDFQAMVRRQLARNGADPHLLVLEITEDGLIGQDDPRLWGDLDALHAIGVRIAVDDYGTGYASLGYLRQPSVDIVKIDRMFVRELTPRARRLIEGVSATLRHIGVAEVVEGVERPDAVELLIAAGCPYAQGFYYARPMPVDDAAAWAADRPAAGAV